MLKIREREKQLHTDGQTDRRTAKNKRIFRIVWVMRTYNAVTTSCESDKDRKERSRIKSVVLGYRIQATIAVLISKLKLNFLIQSFSDTN